MYWCIVHSVEINIDITYCKTLGRPYNVLTQVKPKKICFTLLSFPLQNYNKLFVLGELNKFINQYSIAIHEIRLKNEKYERVLEKKCFQFFNTKIEIEK